MAVPLREIADGELLALLSTDRVPVAAVVETGVKMTLKEMLWPGGIVTGNERLLTVKAELETVT